MPTWGPLANLASRTPSLAAVADRAGQRLVDRLTRRARPGTRLGAVIDRASLRPTHAIVAWVLFSVYLIQSMDGVARRGYPEAWIAVVAIPLGALLLRRPVLLGLVMAAAATWIRAVMIGYPETCDQMAVSRAALVVVSGGGGPYGFGYPESVPPNAPFPYGPLATLTSILGVPGEIVAMAGILVLLAWCRALVTLAFLGAWINWVELGVCGLNDQVPAFLLLAGLLLLERRRVSGALLVALSAGIKPYTFAWVPPLMGYGGGVVAAILLGVVGIAWAPLLWWGPRTYLESIELARGTHPFPENSLNMPHLRVLAIPVAIAALFVRSWSTAVLTGALIFMIVLFLDFWASFGYWLVVIPPVGVVVERALWRFGERVRRARTADPPRAQVSSVPGIAPAG